MGHVRPLNAPPTSEQMEEQFKARLYNALQQILDLLHELDIKTDPGPIREVHVPRCMTCEHEFRILDSEEDLGYLEALYDRFEFLVPARCRWVARAMMYHWQGRCQTVIH